MYVCMYVCMYVYIYSLSLSLALSLHIYLYILSLSLYLSLNSILGSLFVMPPPLFVPLVNGMSLPSYLFLVTCRSIISIIVWVTSLFLSLCICLPSC
jgi:hypothetical protein